MNFSVSVVGFGLFRFDFENIDRELSAEDFVAFVLRRLRQLLPEAEQQRLASCVSKRILVFNASCTIKRTLIEPAPALPSRDNVLYTANNSGTGSTVVHRTIGEVFNIFDDEARQDVAWLYFCRSKQSLTLLSKIDKRLGNTRSGTSLVPTNTQTHFATSLGPGVHTYDLTLPDLALLTVGDLKKHIAAEAKITAVDLEVTIPDGVPQQLARQQLFLGSVAPFEELVNDQILFPILCHSGSAVLKVFQREGLSVSVRIGDKSYRASRFTYHSTVGDVRRRLLHSFNVSVDYLTYTVESMGEPLVHHHRTHKLTTNGGMLVVPTPPGAPLDEEIVLSSLTSDGIDVELIGFQKVKLLRSGTTNALTSTPANAMEGQDPVALAQKQKAELDNEQRRVLKEAENILAQRKIVLSTVKPTVYSSSNSQMVDASRPSYVTIESLSSTGQQQQRPQRSQGPGEPVHNTQRSNMGGRSNSGGPKTVLTARVKLLPSAAQNQGAIDVFDVVLPPDDQPYAVVELKEYLLSNALVPCSQYSDFILLNGRQQLEDDYDVRSLAPSVAQVKQLTIFLTCRVLKYQPF